MRRSATWTPGSTSPTRSPTRWCATGIDLPDAEPGFLLDGYPRTLAQVDELDGMLAELGAKLDAAVSLAADQDELVKRLLKRAETEGRTDDTEEVIRRRQEVYNEQTAPLIEVYDERGLLVEVDGIGEVDTVTAADLRRSREAELSLRCSASAASRSRRPTRSSACAPPGSSWAARWRC